MDLFIYEENRWTVTFHVHHHSDSGGHYKQKKYARAEKKKMISRF